MFPSSGLLENKLGYANVISSKDGISYAVINRVEEEEVCQPHLFLKIVKTPLKLFFSKLRRFICAVSINLF